MDRQHLTEWIDQYLLDELKEEELNQFRQRLQTDAEFRQEVEMQQAVFLQARKVGREALRSELKEMHQRLALPWPAANPEANGLQAPLSTPETEENQARKFSRYAIWVYLALLQAQLRRRRAGRYSWYTITASFSLLLSASLLAYFLFRQTPIQQTGPGRGPASAGMTTPHLALIPLEREDDTRDLGFGGGAEQGTTAVLIYPARQGARSYRFDDTLRLYGVFVPARLALQVDPKTGGYVLREDSLLYPLQRFQPRQALQPAP